MTADARSKSESLLHVSAVSVDITPQTQVTLGAASDVNHLPWEGVADPLEANLILIKQRGDDLPVLLVSLDLLYAGQAVRNAVVQSSGLPEERVIVAASHTHRAPMTDETKPRLGAPTNSYLDSMLTSLALAVKRLVTRRPQSCFLTANTSQAAHSMNRRRHKLVVVAKRPRFNAFVNAPNPGGVTDETLTTLTLRREDGTAVAAIWNYACHPVASPRAHSVSAHFPGIVRAAIRDQEGQDSLPVLYLQGFSGNTRPNASAVVHSLPRRLRRLLSGPIFEHMTKTAYKEWASDLAVRVELCRATERVVSTTGVAVARTERPGRDYYLPGARPVTFSRVNLGPDVVLIGLSGEVVAEYAHVVRAAMNEPYVCCVGCLDHTFGYVPTEAMLAEGGYESGGFCLQFGLDGIALGVEEAVLEGLASVAPGADFKRHRDADAP